MIKRIALGLGIAALVLALSAAVLYSFGGMWGRTPEMRAAYDDLVEDGTAPVLEGRFVVPIPGCVCHSEDPVLQAEHSIRRINECSRCHQRG